MTVPVAFEASMDAKATVVRIRRKVQHIRALYCGTAIAVPYEAMCFAASFISETAGFFKVFPLGCLDVCNCRTFQRKG